MCTNVTTSSHSRAVGIKKGIYYISLQHIGDRLYQWWDMVTNIHATGGWTVPRNGKKYWEQLGSIRVRTPPTDAQKCPWSSKVQKLREIILWCILVPMPKNNATMWNLSFRNPTTFFPEFWGGWAPQLICTLWYSKASASAENRSSVVQHIALSRHAIRSLTRTVHENEWPVDCSRSFVPIRNS